jgi:hypothetical protein
MNNATTLFESCCNATTLFESCCNATTICLNDFERIYILSNELNNFSIEMIQIDKIFLWPNIVKIWKMFTGRHNANEKQFRLKSIITDWIIIYWNSRKFINEREYLISILKSKKDKINNNCLIPFLKYKQQSKKIIYINELKINLIKSNENINEENKKINKIGKININEWNLNDWKKFFLFYRWSGDEYNFQLDWNEKYLQYKYKLFVHFNKLIDELDDLKFCELYLEKHIDVIYWKWSNNPIKNWELDKCFININEELNKWNIRKKEWISKQLNDSYLNHPIRYYFPECFYLKLNEEGNFNRYLCLQSAKEITNSKPFCWNIYLKNMWSFDKNICSVSNESQMENYREVFYSMISKFMQIFDHERKNKNFYSNWIISLNNNQVSIPICIKTKFNQKIIDNFPKLIYDQNILTSYQSLWIYGFNIEPYWKPILEFINIDNNLIIKEDWNQIYFQSFWVLCECNRWGIQLEELNICQIFIETFSERNICHYKTSELANPFIINKKYHLWIDFGAYPYSKWSHWKIPIVWRNPNYKLPEEELENARINLGSCIKSPECFKNSQDFYIYSCKRTTLIWILFLQSFEKTKNSFNILQNFSIHEKYTFQKLCSHFKQNGENINNLNEKIQYLYQCSDLKSLLFIGYEGFSKYDISWIPDCEEILNHLFKNYQRLENNQYEGIIHYLPCFPNSFRKNIK